MNLARLYSQLIGTCEARNGKPLFNWNHHNKNRREGFEIHHITVRSAKDHHFKDINDPSNLVYMTPREHFIAHHILARLYGGVMWLAFNRMCHSKNVGKITSRTYGTVREQLRLLLIGNTHSKGKPGHMRGKKHTAETREKMSKAKLGIKRTAEAIEAGRQSLILSAEQSPVITCPHCGIEGKAIQIKKWHFDNCHKLAGKHRYADIVICPHCQKKGKHGHLQRHHFDNCKHKPS
ncbi:hypothetical protein FBR42_13795 [Salmonella enterica subsp. enterica serovar Hull]|nr:hypothetical protein [Salmonella enterica subsp. enterica serovar Virchow]ECG7219816.1 hypothetical protein [Salmonella enterica subsp. enterica serovar Hull]